MSSPDANPSPVPYDPARIALGSLIGAVAAGVFFGVNASALGSPWSVVVRVVGIALAVALAAWALVVRRSAPSGGDAPAGPMFSRAYWWIVLAEVVALFAGVRLIAAVLDRPWLGVAWVAVVVGVHFVGLAAVWRTRPHLVLGVVMAVLGVVGFVVGWDDAAAAALVAGVGSGIALLVVSGTALARAR